MLKKIVLVLGVLLLIVACSPEEGADGNKQNTRSGSNAKSFNVGYSHYTPWEAWGYADSSGILKKWADKEGITIELNLIDNHQEAIELFTSGELQAVTMRNIEALSTAANSNVSAEAIVIDSSSNGNDAIVMRNGTAVANLKGRTINLVEGSVSHYLLYRALELNEMSEGDVKLINTKDTDIAQLLLSQGQGVAVAWNPILMQALDAPGSRVVFDSSQLPGEIFSMLVVNAEAPETLKRALSGAWYETMSAIQAGNTEALESMATSASTTVTGIKRQLAATEFFYDASSANDFANSKALKTTMEKARVFLKGKGLYGSKDSKLDNVGIQFSDDTVMGDASNIKLKITTKYSTSTN